MADHLSTKERSVSSSPGRKNSRFEKSEEKRNYEGHVQRRYSSHKGSSSPKRRSRQSSSSRKRKVHHRRPVSQQRSSPSESDISRNGHNSYPERERSHREKHRARSRSPLRRDERHRSARRSRNSSRSPWHRYDRQSSGRRSRSRSRSPLPCYQNSRRYSPVRRHSHRNSLRDERDIRPRYKPYDEKTLKEEIKELLRIEHHHLIDEGYEDSNGDTQGVEWCYKYLDPNIRGHITGGKALLHHRCRQCNRICLHLLGKYGTGKRMCLECAAREREWREEDVPSWYFHNIKQCRHCTPGYGYYYD